MAKVPEPVFERAYVPPGQDPSRKRCLLKTQGAVPNITTISTHLCQQEEIATRYFTNCYASMSHSKVRNDVTNSHKATNAITIHARF